MRFAILSLITIFLINLIGLFYGWYDFPWFDTALHYLGGFFVALLFFNYLKKHFIPGSKAGNALILVGSVALIGVVWEFAEYIASQTLVEPVQAAFGIKTYFMGDLDDTVTDLLMDILGAMTVTGILFKNLHSTRSRDSH